MNINIKSMIIEAMDNNVMKGTELATKVTELSIKRDQRFPSEAYFNALDEMVKLGEIIELDYQLPTMPDKTKSIYFPKNTTFNGWDRLY